MKKTPASDLPLADLLSLALREEKGEDLLRTFSTLNAIERAGVDELREAGVSPAGARRLLAVLELSRRRVAEPPPSETICGPADVAKSVGPEMAMLDHERFMVLPLDTKNHVLGRKVISVGTLNSTIVHPRECFKTALLYSAASVILVHNHPSGDPTPSMEDITLTGRLKEAGKVLGIEVLDHVVIGACGHYVSLKERRLL